MEAHLVGRFNLHIKNLFNHQACLRALASAGALLANPNSADSTRRAVVDALHRLVCHRNGDLAFRRYAVKLLGSVAVLHSTFVPSIIELLCPLFDDDEKLAADALSALSSVDAFTLEEGQVLLLASSSLVSVRSVLVKWIVSKLDENNSNIVVMKPHAMVRVLLGFIEDLFPLIRAKAVVGLASMCRNTDSWANFQIVKGFYDCAASLLRNDEETIRISAITLLCAMTRDMNMKVRVEAFSALGKLHCVSENRLLQSLSKKILGTHNIENTLAEHTMRNYKFSLSSSAGAFVHGIEDEFYEVRMAACESLGNLSILSIPFATAALDLLMDMLNDDAIAVRLQALETLYQMAASDRLIIQEKHMLMFLGLLSDITAITRFAARKLLQLVKLPKLEIFKATINCLLTSLEMHPEEEEDVFFILFCIGKSHAKFALKLSKEFASEVQSFNAGELSLDTRQVAGHLVLIVSATFSNKQKITRIPTILFSYAVPLAGRISRSLGGYVSQFLLSNYLCHLSGFHCSYQSPSFEEADVPAIKIEEVLANCMKRRDEIYNLLFLLRDAKFKSDFIEERLNLSQISNFSELFRQRGEFNDRLTEQIKFILGKVQETWSLIRSNGAHVALRMLRSYKEEMDFLSLDINRFGAGFIAFGLEYVQVIMLVAEIWQHIHAKSFQVTTITSLDILIQKLDESLTRIKYSFQGFSIEEECHLLELILFTHVLRRYKFGICSHDMLKKMRTTLSRLQLLCKGPNISDFIKEVDKYATEGGTSESCGDFSENKLLQLFCLRSIPFCGKFRHIKADLTVLGYNSLIPLRFVSGLPVGITFQVVLYDTLQMQKVWLQMAAGGSFQYIFVDLCTFIEYNDVRKCTLTLPFYATPKATSFVLQACICLEFPDEDALNLKRNIGGPKHDIVKISQEVDVYFVGIDR